MNSDLINTRSKKTSLSVTMDGEIVIKKKASDTFVYSINYLSNKIGKEILSKDFPKIFSNSDFINKQNNLIYNSDVDDSGEYFIFTHTSTINKKNILENIFRNYKIDIEVLIISDISDEIIDIDSDEIIDIYLGDEIIEMSDEFIIDNINEICSKTLEIKKYIDDVDYLCEKLNKSDISFIRDYYNSSNNGVVIDIRKEVAREILLSSVNKDKIESIIESHKLENKQKLKAWCNPYKILHPLVNYSYKNLDEFVINFIKIINNRIGSEVKVNISNFNGSQHQGSPIYYFSIFNKSHKNQSDGMQMFIDFRDGLLSYGIYRHIDESYIIRPIKFDGDLDKLYKFIDDNSKIILDDVIKYRDILSDDIKNIFNDINNLPLTSKDICEKLENKVKDNIIKDILSSNLFDKVTTDKTRYKLSNYLPLKLIDTFKSNGFLTMDMLIDILSKNGVNINI